MNRLVEVNSGVIHPSIPVSKSALRAMVGSDVGRLVGTGDTVGRLDMLGVKVMVGAGAGQRVLPYLGGGVVCDAERPKAALLLTWFDKNTILHSNQK